MLTTAASAQMATVHDRMPIILPETMRELWLNRSLEGKDCSDLLASQPAPNLVFEPHEVPAKTNQYS
jgi:putative SOS response-associated peptidase YedK